jgi:hypothetical protein
MLTLVPLAMTVVLRRSPVRTIPALLGIVWMFGHLTFPRSVLGLTSDSANNSAFRAFGMSLVLVSVVVVLARRRNASLPAAVAAGEVRDDRANEETWSK